MTDDRDYSAREYYKGEVAAGYTSHRTSSPAAVAKWAREQAALQRLLAHATPGATVLDLPCGDGRFVPMLAAAGFTPIGADISRDMMTVGRERGAFAHVAGLVEADGEALPLRSASIDIAVSARFMNLVPLAVVGSVLRELERVVRGDALVEVRVARNRAIDPVLRGLQRARRLGRGTGSSSERAAVARDPLRVHPERALRATVAAAGWRIGDIAEVRTSRLPIEPDPLWFVRLQHAR